MKHNIEKLIDKDKHTDKDILKIIEASAKVMLAFRMMNKFDAESDNEYINDLIKTDSFFASHIKAAELLLKK